MHGVLRHAFCAREVRRRRHMLRVSVVALVAALTACTSYRPLSVSRVATTPVAGCVRVVRVAGNPQRLCRVSIRGDSLVGRLEGSGGPVIAVATRDIHELEVARVDAPKALKRLGVIGLVVGGAFLVLITLVGVTEHT